MKAKNSTRSTEGNIRRGFIHSARSFFIQFLFPNIADKKSQIPEEMLLQHQAQAVVDRQMQFLNLVCLVGRHNQVEIRQFLQRAAGFPGQSLVTVSGSGQEILAF